MEWKDIPSERRLEYMYRENPDFTKDDLRRVYYAFEKLFILRKMASRYIMRVSEKGFYEDIDTYRDKMNWINEFMKSKGFTEEIFRDTSNYRISSEDYDYFYELKTPEQIKEEAERRERSSQDQGTQPLT